LFADSFEKALQRKDEDAVSGSAEVFLSNSGRSFRSEGSKRIQQRKNSSLQPNITAGPSTQPLLQTTLNRGHPITPSSDEEEDSMMEDSEVSETIKAGPLTRTVEPLSVCQSTPILGKCRYLLSVPQNLLSDLFSCTKMLMNLLLSHLHPKFRMFSSH
jgi:hypothetical protein